MIEQRECLPVLHFCLAYCTRDAVTQETKPDSTLCVWICRKSNCNMCVCCAAFTKGAHSLSLQSEVDSFTSLLGDSAKLLRPSPVHRDASWEVDLGRDCEGFSSFSPRRLCGCFECHSLGRTARKTDSYLCPSKCFQNIFLGSLGPEYFE